MDLDTPKHRLVFKDILSKLDSLQNLKTSNIFTATIPQLFYCFIIKKTIDHAKSITDYFADYCHKRGTVFCK